MPNEPSLTTEVAIPACNNTLAAVLAAQYGRLEAGEVRAALEAQYQQVWNQDEFDQLYVLEETHPPYVTVLDKKTQRRGTLLFIDSPRFYFSFKPIEEVPHE